MFAPVSVTTNSLIEILQRHLMIQPDALAFSFHKKEGADTLTYAELSQKARKVAVALQQYCVKGDRALLLVPIGLDYIVSFLGCLYAGVIAVPAYPPVNNHHMHRLGSLIDDARASIIITSESVKKNIVSELPQLTTDSLHAFNLQEFQPVDLHAEDIAFLQYTSGSTGQPKGVVVSHGNLLNNLENINNLINRDFDARGCSWLPPYHDMGLIGGILTPLFGGWPGFLMAPSTFITDPMFWLKLISTEKITVSPAPNFAFDLCVKAANKCIPSNLDLSRWKCVFNGSEPIHAETIKRFMKTFAPYNFTAEAMMPCYGMAETTLMATCSKYRPIPKFLSIDKLSLGKNIITPLSDAHSGAVELTGCGPAIPGHIVVIIDPSTRKLLPSYHVGEIAISGPSVTQGYWHHPELTAKVFIDSLEGQQNGERFYCTGDLGFLDNDQELYVTGRIKDLIIVRGKNYYPHDIERCVVASHPSLMVYGAAAFGLEMDNEEKLVIVSEISRHEKDFPLIYKSILDSVFNEFEISPVKIVLIQQASLPKTSSGKVQRSFCSKLLLANELKVVDQWEAKASGPFEYSAPQPRSTQDIMDWLSRWICAQLSLEIDVANFEGSFTEFGFDSMYAHLLCEDLSIWLNCDIDRGALWKCSTVVEFAEYVACKIGISDKIDSKETVHE